MSQKECPTCGRSDFSSELYMKSHHKVVHGESLREKSKCEKPGCENETLNPRYCSRQCANSDSWKNRDNPAKRKEVKNKISEKQRGEKNSFYNKKHTEEARKKISNSTSGESHHLYGVTGEDHPSHGIASGLKMQKVEETGHTVRSNWEEEIDLMLYKSGFNYEYEPRAFELPNGDTYTPDFIIDKKNVIEVKGWPDEKSRKRAKFFMKNYPDFTYVVVGNRIPCDRFIEWENRSELVLLDELN